MRETLAIRLGLCILLLFFFAPFLFALYDDSLSPTKAVIADQHVNDPRTFDDASSLLRSGFWSFLSFWRSKSSGADDDVARDNAAANDSASFKLRVYTESQKHALASRYLFVRGFAKSGTSWTKLILNLHHRIHLLPQELQLGLLDESLRRLTSDPWQASVEPYKSLVLEWHSQLIFQILELTRAQVAPHIEYVGEKSPKPVMPMVRGARYVYVLRDGRDVLVSLLAHRVRIGGFVDWCARDRMFGADDAVHAAALNDWQYFEAQPHMLLTEEACVRQLARHWRKRVTEDLVALAGADRTLLVAHAQLYRRLLGIEGVRKMKAVDAALRDDVSTRVRLVRYEQLVANTERERASIYEWLSLDANASEALGLYTLPLNALPDDSDLRPDNPFFRKGEPGDWQRFFHADARRWFRDEAGGALLQLGYVQSADEW